MPPIHDTEASTSTGADNGAKADTNASVKKDFMSALSTYEFPLWIIVAGLILRLFAGAVGSKRGQWQPEPLPLENSKCVQGLSVSLIKNKATVCTVALTDITQ